MTRRSSLIIVLASLLIAVIGLYLQMTGPISNYGGAIQQYGVGFAKLAAFISLLYYGTFVNTIYFKFATACAVFLAIGAMFKISHWPFANGILIASCLGIATLYGIYFIRKTTKKRLDILKLIWVLTTNIGACFLLLHFIPREFRYISDLIFWLVFIDFSISNFRNKTLDSY
jgi:hypothetical protein